ncbi:hypothetical protein X975_22357, partial [Stegodyphus mimosarum]
MTSTRRMENSERWRDVGRIEAGQSITDVAIFFGVHHSVISRLWKQLQATQTVVRRHVAGRPRVTTPAEDRYIAIVAKRSRRATSTRVTFMVTASIEELQPRVFSQKDGAPPHWGTIVHTSLNDHFIGRWIGREGRIPWPPRSPDITPLDFFILGFVKNNVYRRSVPNIDDLKARITTAVASVDADMLAGTWCKIEYRLDILRATKGAHMEVH